MPRLHEYNLVWGGPDHDVAWFLFKFGLVARMDHQPLSSSWGERPKASTYAGQGLVLGTRTMPREPLCPYGPKMLSSYVALGQPRRARLGSRPARSTYPVLQVHSVVDLPGWLDLLGSGVAL